MRVLFIGPVGNSDIKDSGYNTATSGILRAIYNMKNEGDIEDIDTINSGDIVNPSIIDSHVNKNKEYDIAILIISLFSLLNPGYMVQITKLLSMAKKRYLQVLWETYPLPSQWKGIWDNSIFDGFIAPSHFMGALIKEETAKPIYYCPYYIDSLEFDSIDIDSKIRDEDIFSVLFVGQNTKRKGIDDAITAFAIALGDKEDAALYIKSHALSSVELPLSTVVQLHIHTSCKSPKSKVYICDTNLDREQVHELYKNSSVLLCTSRGEGFGLPGPEAMCAGIPVIYTNWSSLYETCDMPGNYPVKYTLDESCGMARHGYEKGSTYSVPVISSAIFALEILYSKWKSNKSEYYNIVSANKEIVNQRYGYDAISKCITYIINEGEEFGPPDIYQKDILNKFQQDFDQIRKK